MQTNQKQIIEDAVRICQDLIDGRIELPPAVRGISLAPLKDAFEAAREEQHSDPKLREWTASARRRNHEQSASERKAKGGLDDAIKHLNHAQSVYDGLTRSILKAHEPIQSNYLIAQGRLEDAQLSYIHAEQCFREQVPTKMEYIAVLSRDLDLSSDHTPPSLRMAQRFDKVGKWPGLRRLWYRTSHFGTFSQHQALARDFVNKSITVGKAAEQEGAAKRALCESEAVRDEALAFEPIAHAKEAMNQAAGRQYEAQKLLAGVLSDQAAIARHEQRDLATIQQSLWQKPAFGALVSIWMAQHIERLGKRNTSHAREIPSKVESSDGFYADPTWILLSYDISSDTTRTSQWVGGDGHSGGGGASASWKEGSHHSSNNDSYISSDSSSNDSGGSDGGGD